MHACAQQRSKLGCLPSDCTAHLKQAQLLYATCVRLPGPDLLQGPVQDHHLQHVQGDTFACLHARVLVVSMLARRPHLASGSPKEDLALARAAAHRVWQRGIAVMLIKESESLPPQAHA